MRNWILITAAVTVAIMLFAGTAAATLYGEVDHWDRYNVWVRVWAAPGNLWAENATIRVYGQFSQNYGNQDPYTEVTWTISPNEMAYHGIKIPSFYNNEATSIRVELNGSYIGGGESD